MAGLDPAIQRNMALFQSEDIWGLDGRLKDGYDERR